MSALRPILIVVGLLAALFAAGAVIPSASAATTGAGIPGITPFGGYLGNYLAPDGTRVYCIDSGRDWPSGATGSGTVVTSLTTEAGVELPAQVVRKLSYVLSKYGQTANPVQAAAVNAVIYAYTSDRAASHGAGIEVGRYFIGDHAEVLARFTAIWNDMAAYSGEVAPVASVEITMSGPVEGVVAVTSTHPGAVGVLELEGAVDAATGLASIPITGQQTVAILGLPPADAPQYSIGARAEFTTTTRLSGAVTVYSTGSQQRTIRDAGQRSRAFEAEAVLGPIALPFAPILTSKVADAVVDVGDSIIDTLVAGIATGPAWPQRDGVPIPVVAHGTLYGPFDARPDLADEPGADAPIAGTETLTLTGPGEYRSSGSVIATLPGHYTWVWRIDAAAQPVEVQATLPTGYRFADRFGLPDESLEVAAPQLAATGVAPTSLALAGALMGAGALFGNIARRRALRSA